MGLDIHVQWTSDPPIDPPGAWDDFSYWQMLVHTMLSILLIATLLYYRKRYEPLYAKSVVKMSIAIVGCTIHLWALFIGNEQSRSTKPLVHEYCGLVNFWLQYLLGLHVWFLFMFERMIAYGMLMKHEFSVSDPQKRTMAKASLLIMFTMPVLAICTVDAFANLSHFNQDIQTCTSVVSIKVCMMCWVLFGFIVLYLSNNAINRRMPVEALNEFAAIRDGMALALVCIIYFVGINFTGYQNYAFWRASQLFVLESMYIFCFLRLVLSALVHAVRNDSEYAIRFRRAVDADEQLEPPKDFKDVLARPLMKADFFQYCNKAGAFHILSTASNVTDSQSFTASQYLECLAALERINFHGSRTVFELDQLMNKYIRLQIDNNNSQHQHFIFIHAPALRKLESFLTKYRKNGIEDMYEFRTELVNEINYILGSHFFDTYKKIRMNEFLKEARESAKEYELDFIAVKNSEFLLLSTNEQSNIMASDSTEIVMNEGKAEK